MNTLTSTHGWTDNSDINVKVYAVNTDGVSDAAPQGSTIKYQYVPTTAPAITVDAKDLNAPLIEIDVTLTCLSSTA